MTIFTNGLYGYHNFWQLAFRTTTGLPHHRHLNASVTSPRHDVIALDAWSVERLISIWFPSDASRALSRNHPRWNRAPFNIYMPHIYMNHSSSLNFLQMFIGQRRNLGLIGQLEITDIYFSCLKQVSIDA